MNDSLSQLPLECLQRILEIITSRHRRETLTSLNALLRVNRYIAQVTLPFIYHSPFLSEHVYTYFKERGLRELVRTLLGNVLLCGGEVSKDLIGEFKLDSSLSSPSAADTDTDAKSSYPKVRPLNYLGHLRCLDFPMGRFTNSILQERDELSEDEVAYIEGGEFWSQCPVGNNSMTPDTNSSSMELDDDNNSMDSNDLKERLDRRRKELAWYFWEVGLYRDTLWTLSTPVLDQLEGLSFPLSDIYRWTGVVGRLGRLETLKFVLDEIPPDKSSIDPINDDEATRLYKDEAMQLLVHFVREHTRIFKGQLQTINICTQHHRSRYFDQPWHHNFWMQIYRLLPPMDRPTFLSRENLMRLLAHPEITDLGRVKEVLYIYTAIETQGSHLPRSIEIGRGWVDMPVLTDLKIEAHSHRLLIDQMLLFHCPNLTTVYLSDNTRMYQCQDIIPALPAQLEKVTKLELEGWPALTFHPATLVWATELKVLRICVDSRVAGSAHFIPPVKELNRSYGGHQDEDGLATGAKDGQEGGEMLPLMIQRPAWSWDWKFRQLKKLEFTGEFAFRFQFRMLHGCPALKELTLKMGTEQEDSHVRALTHADFYIPNDETGLDELDPMDPTTAPAQEPTRIIIAHSVEILTMWGAWILSDSLIPTLLYDSFPKLREVSLSGCNGFTLPALITCLLTTLAERISRVLVSIPEPTQEERKELGLLRKAGWKVDMGALKVGMDVEVLKVKVYFVLGRGGDKREYAVLKDVEEARE
ncbi:hypothetical protein KI688_010495 [Linnemannia hyalina]|uniref:F-box domain-containing protein n=1 Tax=Linnemannia hyalina TaxID=64524 RepID=A0A9P7XYN3_9FUNG|nr:hypothetical protein KI688_010495 [Linnemannia hyalina]